MVIPKGPCTHIVDTLAPKYPNRDYFKAKVSTIWPHGPLVYGFDGTMPKMVMRVTVALVLTSHGLASRHGDDDHGGLC